MGRWTPKAGSNCFNLIDGKIGRGEMQIEQDGLRRDAKLPVTWAATWPEWMAMLGDLAGSRGEIVGDLCSRC